MFEKAYYFRTWRIREDMVEALEAYVKDGKPVGGFLTAILANNFIEAAGLADDDNLANLQAYCAYLYNELPRGLWGSRTTVDAWVALKSAEREEKDEADQG